MNFGLNLFSLRNRLGSEESFLALANELKAAGYSFLQFSGAAFDADMICRVSKESRMPVTLTHVPLDRILNDTERLCEEHLRFGCSNIGLGMLPRDDFADEKKIFGEIDALNKAAEIMERHGCKFFYHNHFFEFIKHGGRTVFDYMIDNAPHIHFTVDTYWLQYGGADICDFFRRVKGRMECVHLKDYAIDPVEKKPIYAPLGAGSLNFPKIVQAALECGAEQFFVEQDNAATLANGFENIVQSAEYIKKEL